MFPLSTAKKATSDYSWLSRLKNSTWIFTNKDSDSLEHCLIRLQQDSDKPLVETVKQAIDFQAYQEARDYLERIWGRYPGKEGEIQYLMARCYFGQGLIQEALICLDKALIHGPESTEYLELQADCLMEKEDWRGAVDALNKAIWANPKKVENIYRLGTIYAYHNEPHEALRCFQGCCELKPHNSLYWEMKGEIHLQLEQMSQAIISFEKALRYEYNPDLKARLAYCYTQINEHQKAIRLYRQVLKHDPAHYDSLCNLAAIYQNKGESMEALKLQERAYGLCQNDPVLLNNMAYTLVHLGRTRKATEYYQEALKLAQANPVILYNLAVCHTQKGNWDQGIEILYRLLNIDPDHSEGWALLGNIYDHLTDHESAVDCYNKALQLA
ncbi:Tetratricopeptide TPR_2 repeat protein [Desulfitobacterium hafniense DCB-2]|uniref:Tetratricopeptide repeat protein n=3 Tax=root TaxID=1 RepID=G9XN00_DESHA|nr:tetratricopeptide repeat protein [Desulfitobacterium hafniense]ACL21004.1 Tetratricopeptide TPR_2 repeat protein [Desulfitobacterium hafniense DCB-2]EHL06928.1 tetratricopeptide repeat protein [Desulfitobacterium hafniense DP7]MEA5025429.1 tetratricopeptide repeat protein [Desulfitobacterium hafniense]